MARVRCLRCKKGNVRGAPRTIKQRQQMPLSPAFIPEFSESREMHDTRVELLQLACKSVHPSKEVISACLITLFTYYLYNCVELLQVIMDFMEKTFQFRRCDVLDRKFSLNELLLTYPPLRDPDEVSTVQFVCE